MFVAWRPHCEESWADSGPHLVLLHVVRCDVLHNSNATLVGHHTAAGALALRWAELSRLHCHVIISTFTVLVFCCVGYGRLVVLVMPVVPVAALLLVVAMVVAVVVVVTTA